MTPEIFFRSVGLFIGLLLLGTVLCMPLFKWDFSALFRSSLFTKIVWWIPIFAVFIVCTVGGVVADSIVVLVVALLALKEARRQSGKLTPLTYAYIVTMLVAFAHLALYPALGNQRATIALIYVCFGSALSDVTAYFFGTYGGTHKLPSLINPHKSWEGVAGQIIGSYVGFLLVFFFIGIEASWWLAVGIGIASAAGDILNSIAKRQLGIKDWGQTIPGHGGVLDRFSSLSLALAVGYWLVRLS